MAQTSLSIIIYKSEVFLEVRKLSHYVSSRTDAGEFKDIALSPGQEEMLDRCWEDACQRLTDVLKQYIDPDGDNIAEDDATYTASLLMPSSWNTPLYDAVSVAARDYVIAAVFAQWMRISVDHADGGAAAEPKWAKDADNALLVLRRKLNDRRRPTPPTT